MNKNKEMQYESHFEYSAGILNGTPSSWKDFAWKNLRNRTIGCLRHSVKKAERILIIGIGDGGILPHLRLNESVQTIGVDVNKSFLSQSKKYCDVVLASVSALPLRADVIHLVFFELILHHLKCQRTMGVAMEEAHRVLLGGGKILAVEPSSFNFSGLLLNAVNKFHLYSRLFGGSNYEYALSPKDLRSAMSRFSGVRIKALSFLNPRFPVFIQRVILSHERFFSRKLTSFAWILSITASKTDG